MTAMFGQCARCGGSLTADHKCPPTANIRLEPTESTEPPKLARMIRLWAASTDAEQRQIADEIGCSTSTLSRFLSGLSVPDGRTMVRIMEWVMRP